MVGDLIALGGQASAVDCPSDTSLLQELLLRDEVERLISRSLTMHIRTVHPGGHDCDQLPITITVLSTLHAKGARH